MSERVRYFASCAATSIPKTAPVYGADRIMHSTGGAGSRTAANCGRELGPAHEFPTRCGAFVIPGCVGREADQSQAPGVAGGGGLRDGKCPGSAGKPAASGGRLIRRTRRKSYGRQIIAGGGRHGVTAPRSPRPRTTQKSPRFTEPGSCPPRPAHPRPQTKLYRIAGGTGTAAILILGYMFHEDESSCLRFMSAQGHLPTGAPRAEEYVTVDTQEGTIRGRLAQTYTGKPMFRFEGIPYAEPPKWDLRFQAPQNETLKAVVVWIHGGCFTSSSGTSGVPYYFVDSGVIFVTFNYRLGIFGFLSTGDEVVPGNMGLKDQVEALRWVQRNIAVFGGDPQRVTILGGSAGSASVQYHLLSPMSKGLFKNAIAMSGSALNPWAFSKNPSDRAIRYAKTLGYNGTTSTELLEFLKTIEARTLVVDRNSALSEEDSVSLFTCVWAPSIEPENDSAFLTEEPQKIIAEGRFNKVPFMTGALDLEQLRQTQKYGVLYTEEQVSNLNENFEEIVGCDIRLPTKEERLEGARAVKQFYYNGSDITLDDSYTTALFDSHLFFVEGVDGMVRSMARYSTEPIYYYQFSFKGPLSAYPHGAGASHGDDLNYLFNRNTVEANSTSGIIQAQMTQMWVNFAKYDNPTPEVTSLVPLTWKQYDESTQFYLQITSPLSNGTNVFGPYMKFWHDLLPLS
ncbi:esterase FE4-like [Schistocerca serialis cubense]|uniref:esterase FE4-like n=1 Tax=Schistocerca serialis cubense TaxID=2023355 RepID=UPI00214DF624|nr:esterase FE4-like [Schistocerca serialis cubense]